LIQSEDEMKKKPERSDAGYALRGGRFMRGPKALAVDPEILELCLPCGFASGTFPISLPDGDRILRIATFTSALRKL
jgi:hypothetical protein